MQNETIRNEKGQFKKGIFTANTTDLIGKKFGRLTVIKFDKVIDKNAYWLCQCECGKQCSAARRSLISGRKNSCGCLRSEIFKKNREPKCNGFKNLLNEKRGDFIIVDYKYKKETRYWKLECINCKSIRWVNTHKIKKYKGICLNCYRALNGQKKCKKCKQIKSVNEFNHTHHAKDGLTWQCKDCIKKELKITLPRRRKNTQNKRLNNPEWVLERIKIGAKTRNLEVTITLDDYINKYWNKPCYYCGDKTINGLDRVDNKLGYTNDNSVSCCPTCNRMKLTMKSKSFIIQSFKIANNIMDKIKQGKKIIL